MILQTWTGENNYPCDPLLEEQIFDYSDYSISQYGQTPIPLPWRSQDLPDDRPEWRDWHNFRLQMKCESYYNGKAIINEPTRTSRESAVGGDFNIEFIPALTALHHAFGAYKSWLYSWRGYQYGNWLPGKWTPDEVNKIGDTRQIIELPITIQKRYVIH